MKHTIDRMTKEQLRKGADASGLSRSEVSARLGINQRTFRRWLSGATPVPDWLEEVWRARIGGMDSGEKEIERLRILCDKLLGG